MFRKVYSIQGFQQQMYGLFDQNSSAIMSYLYSGIKQAPTQQHMAEKLMANQHEISGLIGFFEGSTTKRNQINKELSEFMQMIFSSVIVFRHKVNIPAYRTQWHEKADEVCKVLYDMNQWSLREYLYQQIICIEAISNSMIKNDTMGQDHHYKILVKNNRAFSAAIVEGIIADNKQKFY